MLGKSITVDDTLTCLWFISFELDSGAYANVLPLDTYER